MQRIMIVGGAGSGKSTAARLIGKRLNLPVFHMDRDVYWMPGWEERPFEERVAKVEGIAAQDSWVFEGSFSSTYQLRAARADVLIWLDTPLLLRLFRVTRRTIRDLGQTRPEMATGCEEKLSMLPEFWWFIIRTAGRNRKRVSNLYETVPCPRYRFRNAQEVNAFVSSLQNLPS